MFFFLVKDKLWIAHDMLSHIEFDTETQILSVRCLIVTERK